MLDRVHHLLFISNIANLTRNFGIAGLFSADDTSVFLYGENATDLLKRAEDIMQKLSDWLIDNRWSLNTDKTDYSIFHTNRTRMQTVTNYHLVNLSSVESVSQTISRFTILDDTLS